MKNYLACITIFAFLACSKDDTEKDNELPVVTLSSPNYNEIFNAGATVNVIGSITDNKKVAEVHAHISNNNSGALLIDVHRYRLQVPTV